MSDFEIYSVAATGGTSLLSRRQRARESLSLCAERFDHVVVRVLERHLRIDVPASMSTFDRRLLRRFELNGVALALVLIVLVSLQVFLSTEACVLFVHGVPSGCHALKNWLLRYIALSFFLPLCMFFGAPLLLVLALHGPKAPNEDPACCQKLDPELFSFVDVVFAITIVIVVCFLLVVFLGVLLLIHTNWLSFVWGREGLSRDGVVCRIREEARRDVDHGTECPICLETGGPRSPQWLGLRCGHAFHEPCLLEWLQQSRCCPICRLNLHHAYSAGTTSSVDALTVTIVVCFFLVVLLGPVLLRRLLSEDPPDDVVPRVLDETTGDVDHETQSRLS
jgi:hypothetical protein